MESSDNNSLEEIRQELRRQILAVTPGDFEEVALRVFRYQAEHNPVYRAYLSHLNLNIDRLERLAEVPHLPIQFFKHHTIRTGQPPRPAVKFESSGTTGITTSAHTLYDASLYQSLSQCIFEQQYGPLSHFHILALLPSYLERNNSSLVYMVRHFIEQSDSIFSGFYLHDIGALTDQLRKIAGNEGISKAGKRKVLVLGVTFALLDWAESGEDFSYLREIPEFIVMETGGMKGRRREMLREEVHDILIQNLNLPVIHSEYGMTELLSQAYSPGEGLFHPGATMRVLLRDPNDPFDIHPHGQFSGTGGVNVVDLANLDTCSFIETQDLGRFGEEAETFYIMGRFDNSDVRGCSLMVV
ncbi:LuxE/PaaK family acyltransferase [Persicitalea jodogahamensis]|uniref:Acyltransferase n=1 Tax=Persicitalea jodogahamensis TaxID=402147 RepID=A0A8J3G8J8_9BACT|nr:acyl transferase [Persicitalea jodogahamensis]GHB59475.1 acyltransferase [Persicitalea jodogahamensis]